MPKALPERLISFSVRHAALVIAATLVVTLGFGWFALKVGINSDFTSLLPQKAEINRIMKEYGGGAAPANILVLAVTADRPGGDIFEPGRLAAYSDAVREISALPGVQSTVSPFNLLSFGRENGRLSIRPMSPGGAAPAADAVADFRARLTGTGYARNLVVSADATMLISYFQVEHAASFQPLMDKVAAAETGLRARGMTPLVTGTVAADVQTGFYLTRDLTRLLGLAALIVLLFYIAGFRTLRGILLPLLSVVFGTIWTVGFMGIMGYSLTLISVVAPPLILIFGNEYGIYTTSELQRLARSDEAPRSLIQRASMNVAKPIAMAFFTTIVGFMSLMVTEIRQTREFAIAASFGSLSCAFLALFFLPAMATFLRPPAQRWTDEAGSFKRFMRGVARFSERFPGLVLAGLLAVVALFVFSLPRLVFNTDGASYYPQNDRVLLDTLAIYRKAGGYEQLSVSFDAPAGKTGFFLDADVLGKVETVERALRAIPDVSYAISLPDLLRDINVAATGTDALPANRAVITTFSRLLIASGGSSASGSILATLANRDFTRLTVSLRIYNADTGRYMDEVRFRTLLASVQKTLDEHPIGATPVIWGDLMRILSFADSLRQSLLLSMAISVLSILALTIFVFRSFLFGLYPLVPLAAAILLNFAMMALTGIPLDMTTIMVSNVAIGAGVDNSIYLVIQYRRQIARFPADPSAALQETLALMGQPILLSSLSIVAGLAVFATAAFRPVLYFGMLVSFTLLATAGATLVTLPTLLSIDRRIRLRRVWTRDESRSSA